jgi:hypothetical protein
MPHPRRMEASTGRILSEMQRNGQARLYKKRTAIMQLHNSRDWENGITALSH